METTFHRYKAILGSAMRARGLASQRVEVRLGCKILNTMTALGIPDGEMIGRRSHGRLSALNGVVHQGTHELVSVIRNNVSVDWIHRDSARANIRRHVKRLLRKYGYPPDLQDAAVRNVMQQAEALSAEWTA